jgi:elongation factor 1 alpha-like protein
MLTKGMSARIGVTLRTLQSAGGRKLGIPLETFSVNKSMGKVLFRRAGETIGTTIS